MKRNVSDLTIFLCIVFLTIAISLFSVNETTIDIQFHDTYFAVDRLTLAIITLGPLLFIVFLPLAAARKFKSTGTNAALIIGLVLIAVICYSAIELQSNYSRQIEALREEQLPDRSQHLNNIRQGVNLARAFMAVVVLPTVILIYRTARIWKQAHANPHL